MTQGALFDENGNPIDPEEFFRKAEEAERLEQQRQAAKEAANKARLAEYHRRENAERYYSEVVHLLDTVSDYNMTRGLWKVVSTLPPYKWSDSVAKTIDKKFHGNPDRVEWRMSQLYKECLDIIDELNFFCEEQGIEGIEEPKKWFRWALDQTNRSRCKKNCTVGRERGEVVAMSRLARKDCWNKSDGEQPNDGARPDGGDGPQLVK